MKRKVWWSLGALALVFIIAVVWFDAQKSFDQVSVDSSEVITSEVPLGNKDIMVSSPQKDQKVASPLVVEGMARAFEGTVQITLRNERGEVVGRSFATAQQPEIDQPGPFIRAVAFDAQPGERLTLEVYESSAADGLPIHMVKVPLVVALEQIDVLVFYAPKKGHCTKVHAFERSLPLTKAVGSASLERLFAGPTAEEKDEGVYSAMPFGVSVDSISIAGGVAQVSTEPNLDDIESSCERRLAKNQITRTLLEFDTISDVKIVSE